MHRPEREILSLFAHLRALSACVAHPSYTDRITYLGGCVLDNRHLQNWLET